MQYSLHLIAAAAVIVFVGFIEFLDWHGRAEIIQQKYPRLWNAMNNRVARLVLLVVAIVLLTKDFRDAIATAPAPVVVFKAPPPPTIPEPKPPDRAPLVREHLARLIAQGIAIRDRMSFDSAQPADIKDWEGWKDEVGRFLRTDLDAGAAETFRSYDVKEYPEKIRLMNQIGVLEDLANQLRPRPER